MWIWTLNWGFVRDDIIIGSCPKTPDHLDQIASETNAQAILSLQSDDCRTTHGIVLTEMASQAARIGIAFRNTPMRDFDAVDQRTQLPVAMSALQDLLASGNRTYVHCTAGINRAPLTVLAYLTFVEGMDIGQAMAMITYARPEAAPYWDSYYGCRSDLLDE